jgi:hypothetical protein
MTDSSRFIITDPKTGGDCLGGAVPGDHSTLVSCCPLSTSYKNYRDLEVNESTLCHFRMSGSTSVYRVIRVA